MNSERKGQPGITVSWYYRPEQVGALCPPRLFEAHSAHCQTYHPANKQFWEGEVFKTSTYISHLFFGHSTDRMVDIDTDTILKTNRPLRGPPSRRYHREDRLPVHRTAHPRPAAPAVLVRRVPAVRLRRALQRPRPRVRAHQELELVRA